MSETTTESATAESQSMISETATQPAPTEAAPETSTETSAPTEGYKSMFDEMQSSGTKSDKPMDADKKSVTEEGTTQQEWFYAPGVPGQGEKPEWLIDSKYGNVLEQAKGYKELQKAFSQQEKIKAPDEYQMNISDDFKQDFVVQDDDEVMNGFKTLAKESNMPQETFDKIINYLAYNTIHEQKASNQNVQQEEKRLFQIEMDEVGPNREEIIKGIQGWATSNVPSEYGDVVKALGQTAKGVRFLEFVSGKMRIPSIPTTRSEGPSNNQASELAEMMRDSRYKTDYRYRNQVQKKYEAYYNK